MEFDAVLIASRKEKMLKEGYWLNKTIIDSLRQTIDKNPDKTALVGFKVEDQTEQVFSYHDLWNMTNKIALG